MTHEEPIPSRTSVIAPCPACSGSAPVVVGACVTCGGDIVAIRTDTIATEMHHDSCPELALKVVRRRTEQARATLRWKR